MLQHRQGHHEGPLGGEFGLAALALAHAFADNPTGQFGIGLIPTILASVTVTPKLTGKFHVTCTVNVTNPTEDISALFLAVGHGGGTVDYTQGNPVTVPPSNTVNTSLTVEYGSGPLSGVTFPVGVPVEIDLIGIATVGGLILELPHDAQITVEELPN
jgi:hypothetical protein